MPDKEHPLADRNKDVSEEGQKQLNIRSCSPAMPLATILYQKA
jgi:hypothetical protein